MKYDGLDGGYHVLCEHYDSPYVVCGDSGEYSYDHEDFHHGVNGDPKELGDLFGNGEDDGEENGDVGGLDWEVMLSRPS